MLKSIVSLVVWMRRMTLTAPRAAQGSCSHGKDFVQFISCYEIEKWHSSSPFEKFLKKLAQTESDILFCCLSLCYIILEFFCQSLPSLTQKSTELIILLWESQMSREWDPKITPWLQGCNIVQPHCDSTYILLDLSEASQQGGTMQEYKFSTMLLLIE